MERKSLTRARRVIDGTVEELWSLTLPRAKLVLTIAGAVLSLTVGIGAVVIGATRVLVVEPTVRAEVARQVGQQIHDHQEWAAERVQTLQFQLRNERQQQLREERAWTEGRIEGSKADLQRELQQLHEQMRDLSRKVDVLLRQGQGGN